MWLNLFLVACVYLFLPIEYAVMRNNTVPKNNLILSVTLPPEAREDPEVGRICADFRRKLLWACGLLTLVLVPAVFLPWMSVCTTVALVWLLAALVVPVWVYGRGFAAMKALKRRRGWQTASAGQTVVELGPVKLPRPVKTRWFVPPMVLSVLPVPSDPPGLPARRVLSVLTVRRGLSAPPALRRRSVPRRRSQTPPIPATRRLSSTHCSQVCARRVCSPPERSKATRRGNSAPPT